MHGLDACLSLLVPGSAARKSRKGTSSKIKVDVIMVRRLEVATMVLDRELASDQCIVAAPA